MSGAVQEASSSARSGSLRQAGIATLFVAVLRLVYLGAAVWARFQLAIDPVLMRANGGSAIPGPLGWNAPLLRYASAGVWDRFDTVWYLRIAAHGYDRPAAAIFYPLYPALIHAVSWLIPSPIVAALLVSTTAMFFAVWGMQALLELDWPRSTALRCVILLAVWPASFSLFIPYAEPLVLACTVWSLYFARKDRWLLAGMLGFAGGLGKAVGCLVAVPLAYLGWRASGKNRVVRLGCACLPLLGPGLFAAWNHLHGRPAASAIYALYWRTHVALPWNTLAQAAHQLRNGSGDALLALHAGLLLLATVACLHREIRTEYKLYAGLALAMFLSKSTDPLLQSTDRYVLVLFPAYLGAALATRKRSLVFCVLCCVFALLNAMLLKAYLGWSLVV